MTVMTYKGPKYFPEALAAIAATAGLGLFATSGVEVYKQFQDGDEKAVPAMRYGGELTVQQALSREEPIVIRPAILKEYED